MKNDLESTDRTAKAALAEAHIGSTALAAALLYGTRRSEQSDGLHGKPPHPEDAPETD
jgi:hypothetical protein